MKKKSLEKLRLTSFITTLESTKELNGGNFPTNDGCNHHTANQHNCSQGYCYSDLCYSKACDGPASDNCPI